jgi:hypothetical protein
MGMEIASELGIQDLEKGGKKLMGNLSSSSVYFVLVFV